MEHDLIALLVKKAIYSLDETVINILLCFYIIGVYSFSIQLQRTKNKQGNKQYRPLSNSM